MPRTPNRSAANALEQVYAKDRAEWRAWLAANAARSPGIWLVFDKKSSRADRLPYIDAVEEALCYGWIDSTVRTLDDTRYVQLMAPRKPKSTWARTNKERVERLIAQGLMTAAGLASIELAKANGAWESLDAVEALAVPADLTKALRARAGASKNFAGLAPSARKGYLHWISQAVRPETRAQRIAHVAELAAANQRSRHLAPPAAKQSASAPAKSVKKTPKPVGKSSKPVRKAAKAARTASPKRGAAGTSKRTTRSKPRSR